MRIDRAGTVLYSNASSAALCGEWRCEIGRPASEPLVRRVRETLDSGQANQMDLESDGRVFSFLFAAIADSGYVNLYGRDITDRKRAEEQIQQINRELEERVNQRTAELRAANEFLRESEQRYRTLFDTIDEGFSLSKCCMTPTANRGLPLPGDQSGIRETDGTGTGVGQDDTRACSET